jgi:hypothetical protein
MPFITTDWKTSLAGAIIIVLGALNTFAGVHVPGFDMGFSAALAAGGGLIFAKDSLGK